ncbi:hypothetical protein CDCA_CDCA05G1547 [Cyanidium caldarium]|uniref:mannose-6-phosphate isomerase n=1 Tax=Cyanidium caldarium TaxID=2771 RepID=A0AAV9ITD4_CYACA|nr:hypothetical protein CDCA_CDCA05G1547 [Cyanidium caldarium]
MTPEKPPHPPILPLQGHLQHYAWGRHGSESLVARYASAQGAIPGGVLVNECYAELWLGAHPSGEALAVLPDGRRVGCSQLAPGAPLPFLLKVLSVRQALSLQVHPDRERAAVLHAARPDVYRDANHKPEMAVCIGDEPFEALCGFRSAADIRQALAAVPELRELAGAAAAEEFMRAPSGEESAALRPLFTGLMRNEALAPALAKSLLQRLSSEATAEKLTVADSLFMRLHTQFPGDVGVFAPYLLHYVQLQPGEALYMGPNEPHAYLSGHCVEVMACSDNVVRAGLTPKPKDIDTLCDMLQYVCRDAFPRVLRDARQVYRTPAEEFALQEVQLVRERDGEGYQAVERCVGVSMWLCVEGDGWLQGREGNAWGNEWLLAPGMTYWVGKGVCLRLRAVSPRFLAYRAHAKGALKEEQRVS